MSYSIASTIEELCGKYIKLRKKIIRIKKKHKFPETDGRAQILNNIGFSTMSIVTRLNIFIALNKGIISHSALEG